MVQSGPLSSKSQTMQDDWGQSPSDISTRDGIEGVNGSILEVTSQ